MTDKKYCVFEPIQAKFGGWFGKITLEDQKTIIYETLQPSKQMCFNTCVWWIEEYTKYHPLGWRPDAEDPQPEGNP